MKRCIICIGNRFVPADTAGPAVFDRLQEMRPLPAGIEIIDGGMAGLNLLPLLERGGRVVFVDAVRGFAGPGEVVMLERREIVSGAGCDHFDHNAGLASVLTVLPRVCDGDLPEEIVLVGLEGECTPQTIERAANLSIAVAAHGVKDLR